MYQPDWLLLAPELLARINNVYRSGEFRLTCSTWRAAADTGTDKLRLTTVPERSFQGRGATDADFSILDVRCGALKVLEIETLIGCVLQPTQHDNVVLLLPLNRLCSFNALTALKLHSASAAGYAVNISSWTATNYVQPKLLPAAIRELDLSCSLPQGPVDLIALAALKELTQLRCFASNRTYTQGAYRELLSDHLTRLTICTQLRGLDLRLYYKRWDSWKRNPQFLRSSVSQLTALQGLKSLSLYDYPLEAADIGQALSMLTGLTSLRLMVHGMGLSGEAAKASLGPLRGLRELQQLAIKVEPFSPPQLQNGQIDDGFLSVLATLRGALQLGVLVLWRNDYRGLEPAHCMDFRCLTRLTSLEVEYDGVEISLDVQSLSDLRGLESLTWKAQQTPSNVAGRHYDGLLQLGQLPLTALHLANFDSSEPQIPNQLAVFTGGCTDHGRLLCLSVEQTHAFSDIDLEALGMLTSLTSLKLLQMRGYANSHIVDDLRRSLVASADSTAIDNISRLTDMKRLHLEQFPSICDEKLEVLQTMQSLQNVVLENVMVTLPAVNELTMLSDLRAISITSDAGAPIGYTLEKSGLTYVYQESLLTGLSVLEKLMFVQVHFLKLDPV